MIGLSLLLLMLVHLVIHLIVFLFVAFVIFILIVLLPAIVLLPSIVLFGLIHKINLDVIHINLWLFMCRLCIFLYLVLVLSMIIVLIIFLFLGLFCISSFSFYLLDDWMNIATIGAVVYLSAASNSLTFNMIIPFYSILLLLSISVIGSALIWVAIDLTRVTATGTRR